MTEINNSTVIADIADNGRFDAGMKYSGPKANIRLNAGHIRDYRPPLVTRAVAGDVTSVMDISKIIFGFGVGYDQSADSLWFGSVSAFDFGGDDQLHRYELNGTFTEDVINTSLFLETTDGFAADLAYNPRTGMLWQTEIDNENCIHEIDPSLKVLTGNKLCPEGIATGQHGLAYDPVSDTFFSGSWNDSLIHRFTSDGELLSSVNTGLAIAGLAYNPTSRLLYVSVSSEAPDFDVVVLSVPGYEVIGGFNVLYDLDEDGTAEDAMSDLAQGGLTIACDGSLWMVEQTKQLAFNIDTEETEACEWSEVSWLIANANGELNAEESESQSITLNATDLEPGTYQAQLLVQNSSPYGSVTIPVTLNATEAAFGTLQFAVTSAEVNEEEEVTIALERIDGSDFEVGVDYVTRDGSAVAGTDYTETTGTLTWQDRDSDSKVITVPVSTLHKDKTFSIELSNAQGGATLGQKNLITITIKDRPKGSGSSGVFFIMLLTLAGFIRRKVF